MKNLEADYSPEATERDYERYMQQYAAGAGGRRRARAVMDFERRDDDELGFRKHDILTVIALELNLYSHYNILLSQRFTQ